ncbi:FAD-dependent oxidoreductase [Pseudomonas sp. ACM7]|uniref:FAD-dependent oxidoreductase n=1 Tax=Pseudomonas sp. ACM7 TaxID=2052956 RepID=UPI0010106A84|nr:FAD-dependent oxidoreductase [Pseudomonas sp. ACM7]QAY90699.1 hypothetical protein CUN63_12475 [Pseudomonas sp. ACM7]
MHRVFDFVVIGGGPAGCGAALALARSGARVALLERAPIPGFKPGEIMDPTLHGALAGLGIGDSFKQLQFPMLSGNVALWGGNGVHENPAVLNAFGHGVLVDRVAFERWLLDEVIASGAEIRLGATDLHTERRGGGWEVRGAGFIIQTGFVIEATGRAAGQIAPASRRYTDQKVCLLAYPDAPSGFHDCRLHIEAVEFGWWYSALLPGRKLVVALCLERDVLANQDRSSRSTWFWAEHRRTKLLPQVTHSSIDGRELPAVRGYPASSSLRSQLCGPGWVVIGDAAASYDPLLGRGVPLALVKGAAVARLLTDGSDLDHQAARYAQAERHAFDVYLAEQRAIYGRVANLGLSLR